MKVFNYENPECIGQSNLIIMPDTNILYDILDGVPETMNLLDYIVTNGGVICISEKSIEELNIATDRDVKKENKLGIERKEEISISIAKAGMNYDILFGLESVYPNPLKLDVDDVISHVTSLRKEARLPWSDAYILATALHHNVPYLWTRDKDFAYLKNKDISIVTNTPTMYNFKSTQMVHHTFLGFK